jgi:hypothetical protein
MEVIRRQTKGVTTLHPADPLFRSVSALIVEYHASWWQNNDSRGYASEVSIIKNPRNYTTHTQWGGGVGGAVIQVAACRYLCLEN